MHSVPGQESATTEDADLRFLEDGQVTVGNRQHEHGHRGAVQLSLSAVDMIAG